ncbi:UNVERIFIED_CONTAM: hypothetical protein FKN15_003819 [Acipenser sinensis]
MAAEYSVPNLNGAAEGIDEHEQKIRELLVARRQEVYESNEVEVSKRWSFEEAIKRPYFHVKPLDRAQLRNWHSYLDFEMEAESGAGLGVESGAGSGGRAGLLFERCLVACALYEEFWSKYAKFQAQRSVDGARSVFRRACEIHLPRKPSMHLLWAAFEEQQGNLEEARRVLEALDQSVPGLAMVRLRRASLERRAGNLEGAESLLREAVLQSQATPLRSFYSIKLARQLLRVQRDHGKARRVLQDAIDRDPVRQEERRGEEGRGERRRGEESAEGPWQGTQSAAGCYRQRPGERGEERRGGERRGEEIERRGEERRGECRGTMARHAECCRMLSTETR